MSAPKHHLSGTGTGKPPPPAPAEKSKFVQTCNRLSLFLKEKGSIRDLNFGINPKFDATGVPETSPVVIAPAKPPTIDLLSSIDDSGEKTVKKSASADLQKLPQYVILDSSSELANSPGEPVTKPKTPVTPKTAQMTIFYEGQVVVFDDVPADRARDLMLMAKTKTKTDRSNEKPEKRVELASTSISKSKSKAPIDVTGSKEPIKPEQLQTKDSDLPIARRASLHKFLAKRKDRATVRAPYQVQIQSPGGSSSGNEHSFDLNM